MQVVVMVPAYKLELVCRLGLELLCMLALEKATVLGMPCMLELVCVPGLPCKLELVYKMEWVYKQELDYRLAYVWAPQGIEPVQSRRHLQQIHCNHQHDMLQFEYAHQED